MPIIFFLVQIKVSWWCVNYLSWVILNTIYLDRTGICFFGFQTSCLVSKLPCLVHCPFKWCVSEVVLFAVLLFGFSFSATVQKVLCSPVKWTFSTAQKKMLLHILDVQSSVWIRLGFCTDEVLVQDSICTVEEGEARLMLLGIRLLKLDVPSMSLICYVSM